MTLQLTAEQDTILSRIVSQSAPVVVINAGPGCAKTTTVIEAIKLIAPSLQPQWVASKCKILYTAFNKDIVVETQQKLAAAKINGNMHRVNCSTFNSIGYWILGTHMKDITVNRFDVQLNKTKSIIADIRDEGRFSIARDEYDDIITLVRFAKSQGYLPKKSMSAFPTMLTFDQLCEVADVTPSKGMQLIVDEILIRGIQKTFTNRLIDLDDQLYMSAFFCGIEIPSFEFIFVDECQDLTPVQLFLLKRLKTKNLILVGDPLQAIYGFRGAMSNSFAKIKVQWPDAVNLPLQTSFRIPQRVLAELATHNPSLRTASVVIGNVINNREMLTLRDIFQIAETKSIAFLCRNNAPLYRVAMACISNNSRFQLNDTNWGNSIVRDIKRVCGNNLASIRPDTEFVKSMADYWTTRAEADPKKLSIALDKIQSLSSLIELTAPSSASALSTTIDSLQRRENKSDIAKPIIISTAHKAKGLEFEFVVHVDQFLIPSPFAKSPEDLAQEANIRYVINSRTKRTLMFLNSLDLDFHSRKLSSRPSTKLDQPL